MVSINNVYQKVLALANKEQRGYITPQEFNLFADQAQQEIFEQYFYDLEQRQRGVGNKLDYADIQNNIEQKIGLFEEITSCNISGSSVLLPGSDELYRLGTVRVAYYAGNSGVVVNRIDAVAEQIEYKDFISSHWSPLTKATRTRPICYIYENPTTNPIHEGIKLRVYPLYPNAVTINYIRKPKKPNWTYTIANGQNAMFNPGSPNNPLGFQNFELHPSEESKLVVKILGLTGVAIKDFNLAQLAGQKEAATEQQQKQ